MRQSLTPAMLEAINAPLAKANGTFQKNYPGEGAARQPVHTVYGGAHLFKADTCGKLGAIALRNLADFAPNFGIFAKALGLRGCQHLPETLAEIAAIDEAMAKDPDTVRRTLEPAWFAHTVYSRVVAKLKREPIEDFRIDFEDGYGNRADAEEDATALQVAAEVAAGMKAGSLPPFLGFRIKPLTEELRQRSLRTLDLVYSNLLAETGGKLPANFVVTLPKVTIPEQAAACVQALEAIEQAHGLPRGTLKMELMIETTQSILDAFGNSQLPLLYAACRERCVAAHFGVYDYTACCSVTAAFQHMRHPACDFARHMMQVAFAGTGVWLSDGATNVMPIPPHRAAKDGPALTPSQIAENIAVVHRAWKVHFDDIQHSLNHAYYQGWDLNPAQLPGRYAAVYSFFLDGFEAASTRLRNFVEKAGQATLVGDIFDDAATGQGLLNFFLRGLNCGAITEAEALATGLTLEELRGRSFVKILKTRRERR